MAEPKPEFAAPDPAGDAMADPFDPKSTAKLTYGTASYEIPRDVPVTPQAETRSSRWLVSILILLIAALMVWIERVHIMHIWPPSTRLFDAITALIQQFFPHNGNLPKD